MYGSHGVQFKLGDALVSPTYTTVAQVVDVDAPNLTRGHTPAPTHDAAAGSGIRKIADALFNSGQVGLLMEWDPNDPTHDESTGLEAWAKSGETRACQVVAPSSLGQFDFNAFVAERSFPTWNANSGTLQMRVVVEIDGDHDWT